MDQNQRPHSRQKTTESGSADVKKGNEVNTGSRPVGEGGRGTADDSERSFPPSFEQQPPVKKKLNPKLLLLLLVVVLIAFFAGKVFGGGPSSDEAGVREDAGGNPSASDTYSKFPPSNDSKVDLSVSSLAREKRVTPVGGGNDTVTVMIYMCGTDLESKYGMATKDLQEMLDATISNKINVIVETGGCSRWQNDIISNTNNQIYKVEDNGLRTLESNAGNAPMTSPKNLTQFVNYCARNYPADRNILIFWDHGGGSITGYGYDEKNPSASSMTLSKINTALDSADCVFDWVGFDACLMATLETALVCNQYADYMVASEETEPGTGWDYTGWLTALSQNTSIPTVELSKIIIDDFVTASQKASPRSQVTLSVIDLAELQGAVPDAFRSFSTSTNELIQSGNYQQVSNARAGVRQFAQSSRINQVDLVDFALRIGSKEAQALSETLQGCVKYNQATMSRCYGISIYFPYETVNSVKSAVASYQDLGMDSEYTKCIQSFASLEYGGQLSGAASQMNPSSYASPTGVTNSGDLLSTLLNAYAGSGSSTSPLGALMGAFLGGGGGGGSYAPSPAGFSIDPSMVMGLLSAFSGRSMPENFDWVDTDLIADQAENISQNYLDPSKLVASDKDGKQVLSLTDEEWALIQTVELNVFVDDGFGYIDLGLDNTFDWDDSDLLLDCDGTWLTLNGNTCAYYLVSDTQQDDGSWVTVGRIPALLNDQLVNLQVVFDDAHPEGVVTGAYPLYEDEEIDVLAKGDISIEPGDNITLLCDYYEYDGTYSASYELGDSFAVPEEGLSLSNMALTGQDLSVTYRLTDIYGNHYWLPVAE